MQRCGVPCRGYVRDRKHDDSTRLMFAMSVRSCPVALITMGGGLCTGSVVNNGFGSKQIFLTASHCLVSQSERAKDRPCARHR